MTDQPISAFLSLTFLKKVLQVTDNQEDDLLLQFVNNANKKVHSDIFPYIDAPILEGSPYWSRCADAALAYARSLHAEDIEALAKSEHYLKKYDYEIYGMDGDHGLVQELKATRTTRTKTVLVTYDPRNEKTPMPTQNNLFTFDEFS